MDIQLDKTHECECNQSWSGLEFASAGLMADGRLSLSHRCETHPDEVCIHKLSSKAVRLVREALEA